MDEFQYGRELYGSYSLVDAFYHLYGDDPHFIEISVLTGKIYLPITRVYRPVMSIRLTFFPSIETRFDTDDRDVIERVEDALSVVPTNDLMKRSADLECEQYYFPKKDVAGKRIIEESIRNMTASDLLRFVCIITDEAIKSGKESLAADLRKLLKIKE